MSDKGVVLDNTQSPATVQTQGDDKLYAGKYKTVEELEKGYSELLKTAQTPTPTPEPTPATETPKPTQTPEPSKAPEGIDISKYETEFTENGALTEDSYTELAAKGISKEMVDEFISGRVRSAQDLQTQMTGLVGGDDKYAAMVEWAGSNLTEAEIEAFDTAIASGNPETMTLAINGLNAKFTQNSTQAPSQLTGNNQTQQVSGYASHEAMVEAMKDPRYQTDSTYRQEVMDKVAASPFMKQT